MIGITEFLSAWWRRLGRRQEGEAERIIHEFGETLRLLAAHLRFPEGPGA